MADETSTSRIDVGGARMKLALLKVMPVGGARAATIVLDGQLLVAGRRGSVTGALALDDGEVSRRHAVVEKKDGGWTIADQGSHNGTFVNGARVEEAPLVDGTVVRLGRTLLVFVEPEVRGSESFSPSSQRLIGGSVPMMRLQAEVAMAAPHPVPVLILGESGVGKELVAEELHLQSGRKGAFVPVNCAAIAPTLAESELFGHVSGAFTGARGSSQGLLVAADKGTIFLDEIGEMPLDLQAKLLRALAKGEVRPVGSATALTVDVRAVAATNRDLAEAVDKGTFRGDLYARLSGWTLRVPSLRARRDDVIALAASFLERRGAPPLSVDAAEALLLHGWPYNVRELEQVIGAAAVRAGGAGEVRCEHLPPELVAPITARAPGARPAAPPLDLLVARDAVPDRDALVEVLRQLDGSVARVAEYFGKDRQQIYRWAKRHGIDLDEFR